MTIGYWLHIKKSDNQKIWQFILDHKVFDFFDIAIVANRQTSDDSKAIKKYIMRNNSKAMR